MIVLSILARASSFAPGHAVTAGASSNSAARLPLCTAVDAATEPPRLRKRDRVVSAFKGIVRGVRGPLPAQPQGSLRAPPAELTTAGDATGALATVVSWYDSGTRLQPPAASLPASATDSAPPVTVVSWYDSGVRLQPPAAPSPAPSAVEEVKPKAEEARVRKTVKNVASPTGVFAPLVLGAKRVMGEQQLKELRAAVIAKHSKVIAEFVDTSESSFGQLILARMFAYADKDSNGTLDKEEVRDALRDLGFGFITEKQIGQIMKRADKDENEVIDFEEFVKDTPKVLRTNLIKLAKQNGHDLGFLA